jgi:hypothetical protein
MSSQHIWLHSLIRHARSNHSTILAECWHFLCDQESLAFSGDRRNYLLHPATRLWGEHPNAGLATGRGAVTQTKQCPGSTSAKRTARPANRIGARRMKGCSHLPVRTASAAPARTRRGNYPFPVNKSNDVFASEALSKMRAGFGNPGKVLWPW